MKRVLLAMLFLSGCDHDCRESLSDLCAREPAACRSYAQRVAELDALAPCSTEAAYPISLGSCGARRALLEGGGFYSRTTLFRDDDAVAGVRSDSDTPGDNGCFSVAFGESVSCELAVEDVWCVSVEFTCGQRVASAADCFFG